MARRFAKVSEEEIVAINEPAFFYPSDLVGEEWWIYTSTLRVSVYIHHYSPPLRGIVVSYISECSYFFRIAKTTPSAPASWATLQTQGMLQGHFSQSHGKNAGGWSPTQEKRRCHGLLPFSGKKGISGIWCSKWRTVFLGSPRSSYLQQIWSIK